MKMLFFSSDETEVQTVCRELLKAGIPCEIRHETVCLDSPLAPGNVELWIQNDQDCYRALMMCVEQGIGFSRRPARPPEMMDDYEPFQAVG